jgi:glycosyltransferase involved in cell wall biosynthesis
LTEAVESILNQTFADFEFLIITEPGTNREIIDAYSDRRIRHVEAPQVIGLARCLNLGIQMAKGEYIARMDADDVSFPDRLERQVTYLDEHQEVGIVGTGYESIDESGRTLSISSKPSSPEFIKWQSLLVNPVAHPSILARAEVIRHLGGYDPAMVHAEDYDLWVRAIANKTNIVNLPDVLIKLRDHSHRVSHIYTNLQKRNTNVIVKRNLESAYGAKISESTVSVLLHRSKQTPIENYCAAKILKELSIKFSQNKKIFEKERKLILKGAASMLYVIALNIRREALILSLRVMLMIPLRELPRLIGSTVKKLLERLIGHR